MRKIPLRALGALAALSIVALVAVACSGDDDDASSNGAAGAKLESGQIAAAAFIDKAGLHGIDVSINDEKTVPPTARTVALQTAAVIRNTEWPEADQASASALADTLAEFAEVLNGDPVDMAKAGELAAKAHDDGHDFTHVIWNGLYKSAGLPVAGGDHD